MNKKLELFPAFWTERRGELRRVLKNVNDEMRKVTKLISKISKMLILIVSCSVQAGQVSSQCLDLVSWPNPNVTDLINQVNSFDQTGFHFTDLDAVNPDKMYTSNTVVVEGLDGPQQIIATRGINAHFVVNDIPVGAIATVRNGDLLAVRTMSDPMYDETVEVSITLDCVEEKWTLTTRAQEAIPDEPGEVAGSTGGTFQVNESGASTYTIPFAVAPGAGGIEPKLALTYSSHGGSNLFGTGWNLSGLSVITRCASTLAQDGFVDGVDFDDNDRFCLDGERLMVVDGGYGEAGSEYRTEQNSHRRIRVYNVPGSSQKYFVVETKSGLILEYGRTPDSRIEAAGRSDVLYWAVSKISDTLGNYMTVGYTEDNVLGEYYPRRIDYTAHDGMGLEPFATVYFYYEDKPDARSGFISGSQVTNSQRIRRINTTENGEIFRSYRFEYEQSLATDRSRLLSIQECGSDGTCLDPTNFEYYDRENAAIDPIQVLNRDSVGRNLFSGTGFHESYADLNGDGFPDKAWVPYPENNLWVALGNGSGFDSPQMWIDHQDGLNPYSYEGRYDEYFDLNGDGLADKVWLPYPKQDLYAAFSNGSGFDPPQIVVRQSEIGMLPYSWQGKHEGYGDVNGDGLIDRLWVPNGLQDLYVCISNGSGFDPPQKWLDHAEMGFYPWSTNGYYDRYFDVNADGMVDKLWVPNGHNDLYVALSNGNGFSTPEIWLDDSEMTIRPFSYLGLRERYVDLTGDGLPEKVWIPYGTDNLWVAKGTGTGFKEPQMWLERASLGYYIASYEGQHETYADFNGDGLNDRVWIPLGLQDLYVAFSNGDGFDTPIIWSERQSINMQLNSNNGRHEAIIDLDGDGLPDRVWIPYPLNDLYVQLTARNPVDLLKTVARDGQDEVEINYKPLTDPTVYTKGSNATFPDYDFISPAHVVSSYDLNNGVGGMSTFKYSYRGARLHLQGRGFRGFEKMTVEDRQSGIEQRTFFDRRYECVGSKIRRQEQRLRGILISETDNTTTILDHGNGVHSSYVSHSMTRNYELDGSHYSTVITEHEQDIHGNVLWTLVDYGDGHLDSTLNEYDDDLSKWLLGRLTRSQATKIVPNQPVMTRTSEFEYNHETGLLTAEIIEPDSAAFRYEKRFVHDDRGNVVESYEVGSDSEKSHTTNYNDEGRFVSESVNELGHQEQKRYHLGLLTERTGPNGLITTVAYDGFGRKVKEVQPDGVVTRLFHRKYQSSDLPLATMYQKEHRAGSAAKIKYFDFLGRPVREETRGLDGTRIFVDTVYNANGQVEFLSEPYFEGDTPQWSTFEYDVLGRNTKVTMPGNRVTETSYFGLTKVVRDPGGNETQTIANVRNKVVETIDENGFSTFYDYDPFGNPIQITDPEGNVYSNTYNIRGHKTSSLSPNSGLTTFQHDARGQLISQTDANGNTTRFSYDELGRHISRQNPEGTITWSYDAVDFGIGKMVTETSMDGITQVHRYDLYGRRDETRRIIDGKTFITSYAFDQYGRELAVTYPSGLKVGHSYNDWGNLVEVYRKESGYTYWMPEVVNAAGQFEQILLGNGLRTRTTYDETNSLILGVETGRFGGNSVQDLHYQFDHAGSLTYRQDLNRSLSESFSYDAQNRLIAAQVSGQAAVTYQYSRAGNITYKSDVGHYTYGENGAGAHAVTSIAGSRPNSYTYDANGNRTGSNQGSIVYTSFNKAERITNGNVSLEFSYDSDLLRAKSVKRESGIHVQTKYYIGSRYELIQSSEGIREIHHIFAAGQGIAVEEWNNDSRDKLRFVHKDHLGSVQAITDEQGSLVDVFSYDPWGMRRDPETWSGQVSLPDNIFRGFTGHEMLDEAELVHMNGRLYDPVIGRMLSVDPFVTNPRSGQSFNQYSYVLNNPLSSVDPTGYFFKKLFKVIKKVIKKVLKNPIVRTLISVGVGVLTGGLGAALGTSLGNFFGAAAFGSVIGSAAGFGFGSTFAGVLTAGGSLSDAFKLGLQSGLIGGISAIATMGLTPLVGEFLANGISQGAASWAQGGRFEHGFLQGVVTKVGSKFGRIGKIIAGGTAAEIGGGKFANGAAGAAFQSYLSDHSGGNQKSKVAYVGGAADNLTGNMKDIAYAKGYAYFTHDEASELQAWILRNKGNVIIYAHSWGADTAAKVVTNLNISVDKLVTLDPVSWIRPNFSVVEKSTKEWINYEAVGGSSLNLSNQIATIGGAWRDAPSGSAIHYAVPYDHASIVSILR